MNDLTEAIKRSVVSGECSIIRDSTVYHTDRLCNEGKRGHKNSEGNSEVEAGHPFELMEVMSSIGVSPRQIYVSLNNIRIFGPISDRNRLHYHGFSRHQLRQKEGAFHTAILTVHAAGHYDSNDTKVNAFHHFSDVQANGRAGLIFIYETAGVLRIEPLQIGDTVVLPSGVYHSFASASEIFASYGAIELCSDPSLLYQTHYAESERETQQTIARTIELISGIKPSHVPELTLADIPGLEFYIERLPQSKLS